MPVSVGILDPTPMILHDHGGFFNLEPAIAGQALFFPRLWSLAVVNGVSNPRARSRLVLGNGLGPVWEACLAPWFRLVSCECNAAELRDCRGSSLLERLEILLADSPWRSGCQIDRELTGLADRPQTRRLEGSLLLCGFGPGRTTRRILGWQRLTGFCGRRITVNSLENFLELTMYRESRSSKLCGSLTVVTSMPGGHDERTKV